MLLQTWPGNQSGMLWHSIQMNHKRNRNIEDTFLGRGSITPQANWDQSKSKPMGHWIKPPPSRLVNFIYYLFIYLFIYLFFIIVIVIIIIIIIYLFIYFYFIFFILFYFFSGGGGGGGDRSEETNYHPKTTPLFCPCLVQPGLVGFKLSWSFLPGKRKRDHLSNQWHKILQREQLAFLQCPLFLLMISFTLNYYPWDENFG